MRKIEAQHLKEGMVLARTLFDENGTILLKKGTKLIQKYINKIIQSDFESIYIEDDLSEGIEIEDVVDERVVVEVKGAIKESISKVKKGNFKVNDEIMKQVEVMISNVLEDKQAMVNIQKIKNQDDFLLYHSINVCILSLVVAKKLMLPDIQLKALAMGSMLHDVGKINIKINCNRHHDDYVNEEKPLYEGHSEEGYNIIKNFSGFSLQAANIARTHHEKYDGTGFPLGLKGNAINVMSRVVAIANEYDNLLNNAYIKKDMKNHEIIEYITARAFTDFDPEIIKIFRQTVAPYPIGTAVVLSDGRIGIVSKLNSNFPTKPSVRIIDSETKKVINDIDLSKERTVVIDDEIDIDK